MAKAMLHSAILSLNTLLDSGDVEIQYPLILHRGTCAVGLCYGYKLPADKTLRRIGFKPVRLALNRRYKVMQNLLKADSVDVAGIGKRTVILEFDADSRLSRVTIYAPEDMLLPPYSKAWYETAERYGSVLSEQLHIAPNVTVEPDFDNFKFSCGAKYYHFDDIQIRPPMTAFHGADSCLTALYLQFQRNKIYPFKGTACLQTYRWAQAIEIRFRYCKD